MSEEKKEVSDVDVGESQQDSFETIDIRGEQNELHKRPGADEAFGYALRFSQDTTFHFRADKESTKEIGTIASTAVASVYATRS